MKSYKEININRNIYKNKYIEINIYHKNILQKINISKSQDIEEFVIDLGYDKHIFNKIVMNKDYEKYRFVSYSYLMPYLYFSTWFVKRLKQMINSYKKKFDFMDPIVVKKDLYYICNSLYLPVTKIYSKKISRYYFNLTLLRKKYNIKINNILIYEYNFTNRLDLTFYEQKNEIDISIIQPNSANNINNYDNIKFIEFDYFLSTKEINLNKKYDLILIPNHFYENFVKNTHFILHEYIYTIVTGLLIKNTLLNLEKNGTLVIGFKSIFSNLSIQLLYLISLCFKKVSILRHKFTFNAITHKIINFIDFIPENFIKLKPQFDKIQKEIIKIHNIQDNFTVNIPKNSWIRKVHSNDIFQGKFQIGNKQIFINRFYKEEVPTYFKVGFRDIQKKINKINIKFR